MNKSLFLPSRITYAGGDHLRLCEEEMDELLGFWDDGAISQHVPTTEEGRSMFENVSVCALALIKCLTNLVTKGR
jgi:hypothetical protein